jgi:hypothetical protein
LAGNNAVRTNLHAVAEQLRDIVEGFDLESTEGAADRLADEIFKDVATRVRERTLAGRDPYGGQLTRRSAAYAKHMGDPLPGVKSGRMLSIEELVGATAVTPGRATMRYGLSGDSRRVMGWFQAGNRGPGARVQPPRPFYDITPADRARLVSLAKDRLRKRVERAGKTGGWKGGRS